MRRDRDTFRDAVAGWAVDRPGAPTGDAVEVCRQLDDRLRAAREKEVDLRGLKEQVKPLAEGRERAKDKLRRTQATLNALFGQPACADVAELPEVKGAAMGEHDA